MSEKPENGDAAPDTQDQQPAKPPEREQVGTLAVHFAGAWNDLLEDPNRSATVLIVDDVEINRRLFRAMLKASPYRIVEARRPSEALALIEREPVDLIIMELVMPEMSGPDFCRMLKGRRDTRLIPILIVTSAQGVENEVAGIESGADEFLIKPLHPTVVRTRVRAMLRNKALIDSLDEAEAILFALAQSVEQRDHFTGAHCSRLAAYSVALGKALGLGRADLQALYRGGYLHDIGKIAVRDSILFKQTRLDAAEWDEMRLHTVRGEEICRPMKSLKSVLPIIRSHHERWDGTGYPDGLKGEKIPLLARVLQVADIYDALTNTRTYKPAMSHAEALRILEQEARQGWRDPELISLFGEISATLLPVPTVGGAKHADDANDIPTSLANMVRELTK